MIVFVMVGFFSPSVHIESGFKFSNYKLDISFLNSAEARLGGGNLREGKKNNRNINRNKKVNRNSNRNKNVNRNINRNVNKNVNVNVNVNHRYYGGRPVHGGFYRGGGYYYGGTYHPVARFTFAMLTAVAIGTIISSASMSSSCSTMNVNGINYKNCDGTWFKPFYDGGNLQYEAVSSPY